MTEDTIEKRINEILNAIMEVARGEYSIQIELSGKSDVIDSLAMGVNMMIEDIKNNMDEIEKGEKQLKEKVEELEKYKEITIGRELRIIELKKEIDRLLKKLGRGPKYNKE